MDTDILIKCLEFHPIGLRSFNIEMLIVQISRDIKEHLKDEMRMSSTKVFNTDRRKTCLRGDAFRSGYILVLYQVRSIPYPCHSLNLLNR